MQDSDPLNWKIRGNRFVKPVAIKRTECLLAAFASVLVLGLTICLKARAEVVEYTDRGEWEKAVRHFAAVSTTNGILQKNVPLNAGLVTILATGSGSVSLGEGTNGTVSLSGSGTTSPWFRHTVTINGGKVYGIGWDWSNSGQSGMYKSVLTHDGGNLEKLWPGIYGQATRGFLGYVDTKGKTISSFWFGSSGACNFSGAGIENICLSYLPSPAGIDSVPPEWAAFDLRFGQSWDEMLAANQEQQWQKELSGNGTVPQALKNYVAAGGDAARVIIGLRRITLLKAMIERFPQDKEKVAEAYDVVSRTSREILLPWWPDAGVSALGRLNEPPRNYELKTRWEALVGGAQLRRPEKAIRPDDVQGVLNLSDRTDTYMEIRPSHFVSYPAALESVLAKIPPEQLIPLREAEEKAVRHRAEEIRDRGDLDEAVALFRRAPWARSVHELLLELGELAMQKGRRQWALASYNDVLTHASDQELCLEARAGQWVALAQDAGDRAILEEAMAGVPDDARMRWRGGRIVAGELKKSLLTTNVAAAVKLMDLARRQIRLPAFWPADERSADGPLLDFGLHTPWPVGQVQAAGGVCFAFGAGTVARFNPGGNGSAWVHTPPEPAAAAWDTLATARYIRDVSQWTRFDRRPVTVRSSHSSAVSDDGRIVCFQVTDGGPATVALDAKTGRLLWSTAGKEDWRDLVPMSRPVTADGRVYVLAIPAGLPPNAGKGPGREPGPPVNWRLVCMDTLDGRVFWTRTLGWQPFTLLDIARGSSGVTILNGAIYCSTDMGIVAKCDVRDGLVDWVRGYASAANADPRADTFSREGTSPLVAGNTVLVAPRDHSGVMAFRSDTGDCLWETIAVPSDKLLGVSSNVVLAINERRLCALDCRSGRTMWSREFPEGTGSQGAIVGGDAIVVSGGRLHRIAVSTGAIIETLDAGQSNTSEPVLMGNGVLVEVKAPGLAGEGPSSKQAVSGALAIPVEEVWRLPCVNPVLAFPQAARGTPEAFCVLSGRRLGYVRTRPGWGMAWERLMRRPPRTVSLPADMVVVATERDVSILSAADGVHRCSVRLPFSPGTLGGDQNLVYAVSATNEPSFAAVIDIASGKLLWAKSLSEGPGTIGSIRGTILRHEKDGSVTLRLYSPEIRSDKQAHPGEVVLDARSGQVKETKRFLAGNNGWPSDVAFDEDAIRYIGSDGHARVIPFEGVPDPSVAWERTFAPVGKGQSGAAFGIHAAAAGLYVRRPGQLVFLDSASPKDTVYELPRDSKVPDPVVLDFREIGSSLVVVSGDGSESASRGGDRQQPDAKQCGMSIHFFDRATGKHSNRQQLPGTRYCEFNSVGYDSQGKVFDDAIVVSAPDGVRVFKPQRAGVSR